jgi:SAM-dependent methyltransferase
VSWDRLPSSYDQVADAYERAYLDELDNKPFDRDLLGRFANGIDGPMADVGCGPGQIGAFLRDPGQPVIGVDVSPAMARSAAARLDASAVADMRALPFADHSLGGVVAFYSIIHLPREELPGTIDEFRRVLRSGGGVLVSAHEGVGTIEQDEFLGEPVPFVATLFTLEELEGAMRQSGLLIRRAERRAPYPVEHPTTRLYVEAAVPPSAG